MNDGATAESIARKNLFFDKLTKAKKGLNPQLVNNPKFEELFLKEMSFIYRKTLSTNIMVQVAEDKNSVSLTSYNPLQDCGIKFKDNNRSFFRTVFSLSGENMKVEYNQGTLFNRRLLEKKGIKVKFPYESKMETEYTCNFYDTDGIEYSNSSYKDSNHFDEPSEDIDLREKVMSSFYKPVFYEYQFPELPVHIVKANLRNTYRKNESLGVIHSNVCVADKEGYHELACALYTSHPLFPEVLRGCTMIARTDDNSLDLKFNIVDDYAPNINSLYEKARDEFKSGIAVSPIAKTNSLLYSTLVERLG